MAGAGAATGVVPAPVAEPGDVAADPPVVAAGPADAVPAVVEPLAEVPDAVPVAPVAEDDDGPAAVLAVVDSSVATVPVEEEPALFDEPVLPDAAVSAGLSDDGFWSLVSVACLESAGCAFP